MDEYTTSIFVNDDAPAADRADNNDDHRSDTGQRTPLGKGIRGRVAALRDKAALQDRLLEK